MSAEPTRPPESVREDAAHPGSPSSLALLALSTYCLLILPRMLSYGMFFDGVTYASISRNLAEGAGSTWAPHYTATLYPVFYEHPPLHFWLQSAAFKVFGDHAWVERLWGFALGLHILAMMRLIWRRGASLAGVRPGGAWFPVLLLTSIPMTSWLLANNMLEIAMTACTTTAVWFAITSMDGALWRGALLAGIMTLAAILTKGPFGLFPLAAPFGVWLAMRHGSLRRATAATAIMLATMSLALACIIAIRTDAAEFFRHYVNGQLLASLAGHRERTSNRLSLLYTLVREIAVPLGLCLAAFAVQWLRTRARLRPASTRLWLGSLFIGVSASFPAMLGPKQMGWYVFPSLPFYALTLAALFGPWAVRIEDALRSNRALDRRVRVVAFVIVVVAVALMAGEAGKARGAKDYHHDFSAQRLTIEPGQTVSAYPANLASNWVLVANLQRFYRLSLSDSIGLRYLVSTTDSAGAVAIRDHYHVIHPRDPARYVVLERD